MNSVPGGPSYIVAIGFCPIFSFGVSSSQHITLKHAARFMMRSLVRLSFTGGEGRQWPSWATCKNGFRNICLYDCCKYWSFELILDWLNLCANIINFPSGRKKVTISLYMEICLEKGGICYAAQAIWIRFNTHPLTGRSWKDITYLTVEVCSNGGQFNCVGVLTYTVGTGSIMYYSIYYSS